MNGRILLLLALTYGAASIAGCNSEPIGQVHGRVTLDDGPLLGASIVFERWDTGLAVTGNLDEDGSFTLRTGEHDGLPPGEYGVAIRPGVIGNGDVMLVGSAASSAVAAPPAIPEKYQLSETSGLTATVEEGANPAFEFDISP